MLIINKRTNKKTKLHVRNCLQCDIQFGSYVNSSKLCSKKCSHIYIGLKLRKGKYINCVECKNLFWSRPSHNRRNATNKFCLSSPLSIMV